MVDLFTVGLLFLSDGLEMYALQQMRSINLSQSNETEENRMWWNDDNALNVRIIVQRNSPRNFRIKT